MKRKGDDGSRERKRRGQINICLWQYSILLFTFLLATLVENGFNWLVDITIEIANQIDWLPLHICRLLSLSLAWTTYNFFTLLSLAKYSIHFSNHYIFNRHKPAKNVNTRREREREVKSTQVSLLWPMHCPTELIS